MSEPEPIDPREGSAAIQRQESGLAHVASLAFVGARTLPGFGFPVALGGGTAIARATEGLGPRRGLAAGAAAAIESIAILGPARMSVPGGQLATAPLIGELTRRGRGMPVQVGAVSLARLLFNLIGTAFFVLVIVGSFDTFVGTYEGTFGRIPGAPQGDLAAVVGTMIGLVIWSVGASWVQVLVYDRARIRWRGDDDPLDLAAEVPPVYPREAPTAEVSGGEADRGGIELPDAASRGFEEAPGRFDPRATITAAVVAFVLLLASTAPPLQAAVALWLAAAWLLAPAERSVLRTGIALAATLAVGSLIANLVGGESVAGALERASRAALLVLVATWMRGAAGADGFRTVARRLLVRAGRFGAAEELRTTLDSLAGERRMGEAIKTLAGRVRAAGEEDLIAIIDAVLEWIAVEASRFRTGLAPAPRDLTYRPIDGAIIVAAVLPALALAPG